jgi:hypothetical protein
LHPRLLAIRYEFQFDSEGTLYFFIGEKRLTGKRGRAGSDLSTVHVSITTGSRLLSRKVAGGTINSPLRDLLEDMRALRAPVSQNR